MRCTWLLLLTPIWLAAQPGNGVQQWHNYVTVQYKGIIPVDEQGNPVDDGIDTVHTLIAEVKATDTAALRFGSVFADGHWWKVAVRHMGTARQVVGYNRETEVETAIQPAAGRVLLQLYLEPMPGQKKPTGIPAGSILIDGKYKGKAQQWVLPPPKELPAVHYG